MMEQRKNRNPGNCRTRWRPCRWAHNLWRRCGRRRRRYSLGGVAHSLVSCVVPCPKSVLVAPSLLPGSALRNTKFFLPFFSIFSSTVSRPPFCHSRCLPPCFWLLPSRLPAPCWWPRPSNRILNVLDFVHAWSGRWRFSFGIGHTQSATSGPLRGRPDCCVHRRWSSNASIWALSSLPLSLGALTSTFTAPAEIVFPFSNSSFGLEFTADDPPALQQFNLALRRWWHHLLGWPSASLLQCWELGIGDAVHLALGHAFSLFGRLCAVDHASPRPPVTANVFRLSSSAPGTWSNLCAHVLFVIKFSLLLYLWWLCCASQPPQLMPSSGPQNKLEGLKQLTTAPQMCLADATLSHTSRWHGNVFLRFPQLYSCCGAPSIGVSCLRSPELFLQPHAQLQLSTSGDPRLYVCQAPNAFICVSPCGSIFGSILGPFWVQFGSILGPFWVHFGSILGPVWVHFGSSLGPFWVHLGSIWVHLGSNCLNVDAFESSGVQSVIK